MLDSRGYGPEFQAFTIQVLSTHLFPSALSIRISQASNRSLFVVVTPRSVFGSSPASSDSSSSAIRTRQRLRAHWLRAKQLLFCGAETSLPTLQIEMLLEREILSFPLPRRENTKMPDESFGCSPGTREFGPFFQYPLLWLTHERFLSRF